MSEYGYANAKDVLLGKTDTLTKAENYDRFELENVIKWSKRYNKMIAENKVRDKLEVWNQNTMNEIDINKMNITIARIKNVKYNGT